MKILCTGDWHITDQTPSKRIDNYVDTQHYKIAQIIQIMQNQKCGVILQPGDFFDYPSVPLHLIRKYIKIFYFLNRQLYVVAGQHDQRYHTHSIENTPLGILESAGVIQILERQPHTIKAEGQMISLYGSSWGDDIPVPINKEHFNVLVIHRMIIDQKLWEQQTDFSYMNEFLRKHKFDLIVSGDNHKTFYAYHSDRVLINCGSLMRSTIAQIDHDPAVFIFDTISRSMSILGLESMPSKEVFDFATIQEEKRKARRLNAFVEGLKDSNVLQGLDFTKNLGQYLLDNKIAEPIRRILQQLLKITEKE